MKSKKSVELVYGSKAYIKELSIFRKQRRDDRVKAYERQKRR